jgi:hypothetical protein
MPTPDSWICPKCFADNKAARSSCRHCKYLRPDPCLTDSKYKLIPVRCGRCERPVKICECLPVEERVTDLEL